MRVHHLFLVLVYLSCCGIGYAEITEEDRKNIPENMYKDPTSGVTCPADTAAYTTAYAREPECSVITLTEAVTEETCSKDYCCWTDSKCLAKPAPACDLTGGNDAYDLANSATTIVKVGKDQTVLTGGATGNFEKFKTIFLGEEVEFSCKADDNGGVYLLQKDDNFANPSAFGEYKKVTFKCLQNAEKKTTDFHGIWTRIQCVAACAKPKIHDSVTIDVDFTDGKPVGTEITFTCKEGFGTIGGKTAFDDKVACTAGATDYTTGANLKACYQCTTTAVPDEKNAKYSADTAIPTASLKYQCKEGYSFTKFTTGDFGEDKRNELSVQCQYSSSTKSAALDQSHVQEDCIQDCKLKLPPNHGLELQLGGKATTIESIPQDKRYTLVCPDVAGEKRMLMYGQAVSVKCAKVNPSADPPEKPADITVQGCHAPCTVNKLKQTYNVESKPTVGGNFVALTADEVAKGTPLKLADCTGGKVFLFTEKNNNELKCDDANYDFDKKEFKSTIGCYDECTLFAGITTAFDVTEVTDNGGDATFTTTSVSTKLPPNTKVKFTCKDPTHTVAGTKNNFFIAECGTNGDAITNRKCYPSCQVSELKKPNANTLVKSHTSDAATKIAMGEEVDIKCDGAAYVMAFNVALVKLDDYGKCEIDGAGVKLKVKSTQDKAFCIAKATVVKPATVSNGPMKFTATVTLPDDRDTTDAFVIENVIIKDAAATEIATVTVTAGKHSYQFEYLIPNTDGWQDKLKNGYTLNAHTIKYQDHGAIVLPVANVAGFYAGPPSLGPDAVEITAVGAKTVTMKFKDTLAADVAKYTAAGTYEPIHSMKVFDDSTTNIKTIADQSITALIAKTTYDWSAELKPLKTYTVKISSSTTHGAGGEMTTTFKTGNKKPTLSFSDEKLSSTARDVIITLDPTSNDGKNKIKYQLSTKAEVEKEETFSAKKFTISYDDLTPLTAYTFTVTVLTADDVPVPSEAVTASFTQGPTKPEAITANDIAITNNGVTVNVATKEGFTYVIKVYAYDGETLGTSPVQEASVTKPAASQRKKRDGHIVSKAITGLAPNTKHKIVLTSEGVVAGTTYTSNPVEYEFTTYACARQDLEDKDVTPSLPNNAAVPAHFVPDAQVVLTVTCKDDKIVNEQDNAGGYTMKTSQTVTCAASGWTAIVTPCVKKPVIPDTGASTDKKTESDVVVGIVLGILAVLIIVGIILILIYKRNKERGGGGGTENGTSQKYSPRDNEIAADNGGESWRNPYYRDTDDNEKPTQENEVVLVPLHVTTVPDTYPDPPVSFNDGVEPSHQSEEGEPDIGAKENGDNVSMGSQTQKLELGDEEAAVEATVAGETAEEKV